MSVCLQIYKHPRVRVSIYIHESICMCLFSTYVSLHICLCINMHVSLRTYMHPHVRVAVYIHTLI